MKLEEIVGFSLGFMPRKPKSLVFFVPLFLLNMIASVATYFASGNFVTNLEEYVNFFTPETLSENFLEIFLIPQIQITIGFFLVTGILGWVLGSYAEICIYKASELERKRRVWSAREMLGRFLEILPRYLLLSIVTVSLLLIPLGSAVGLVVIWQLGLLNSSMVGIVFVLLAILLGILGLVLMIYLGVRLFIAAVAMVIENKGVIESLKRSWYLTGRSFWYVLGYVVLFFIIIAVISMVLGFPVTIISAGEVSNCSTGCQPSPLSIIADFLHQLIGFYTMAAWVAFSYIIYLSLIEREEKKSTVQ